MPSSNNLIQSLRSAHDPHFKLEGRVGGLEKGLGIQVAQLHKTLSKSFAMQRKTLVRVLGLEKRVAELEAAKAAVQEAAEQIEEEVGDEIPEGLDDILDDVRGEKEVGATATKTKPKTKKKPKIKAKKRKIKGKDLGFKSRVMGTDDKGGYLSGAERKKQFLQGKLATSENKFKSEDVSSADIGDDEGKKDRIVQFLNVDVKDKLDDINESATEIKDVLVTQGDLADDRDEALRQSILSDRKKEREKNLEKKKGVKEKMLESVTKPVGNFLNKLIKFVMMTFVGSVVNRLLTLLKDPAQFLDPIKRFFNFVIGLVNAVMKGLWFITGAPMNFIISGINKGVSSLLDALNKATALLNIPAIDAPQIPKIPGPPEFQFIPLSKTAQEKNAAVGMAEGGVVPGMDGMDGDPGVDGFPDMGGTIKKPTFIMPDGEELPGLGGGGGGTDAITMKAKSKSLGKKGKDIGNLFALPFRDKTIDRDPRSQFASGMPDLGGGGGGTNAITEKSKRKKNIFSSYTPTAQDRIQELNKGGKVPGSGTGDTVPAMLTPGEFVMSKGAVDQIGADKLMEMNAAGGGTNKPKLMKFAGGGMVPGIDAPSGKGRNVVVIGGGGKKSSSQMSPMGSGSEENPSFSSVDPNNVNISVIKSIYNIMS